MIVVEMGRGVADRVRGRSTQGCRMQGQWENTPRQGSWKGGLTVEKYPLGDRWREGVEREWREVGHER